MIPAAPSISIDLSEDIEIVTGTVIATDSRALTGTVVPGTTHVDLNMGHFAWIRDKDDKQHRYVGGIFLGALEGQKFTVVQRRSSNEVIRVYNHATEETTDLNDLKPLRSATSILNKNNVVGSVLLF